MVDSKTQKLVRILIVDDSSSVREVLKAIFRQTHDLLVIGEAENGQEAIAKAIDLKPDLITMDISMPIMNGHDAIEQIMAKQAVPILVVSSLDDAQTSLKAISNGALDLFPKSDVSSEEFIEKVRLVSTIKVITHLGRTRKHSGTIAETPAADIGKPITKNTSEPQPPEGIVAIASSTGGPQALGILLSELSNDFPYPIVIAQHIALGFVDGLVNVLANNTRLTVKKGEKGERIRPGLVYVSPSSKHMAIDSHRQIALFDRNPADIYFPSCDRLLSSAADVYGSNCIGIILTGMGKDGVAGMRKIKAAGGKTIAQDETTSIVFGMPQVAIAEGCIEIVASIHEIGTKLQAICNLR